jgi:predicted ester cyclase
MTVVREHPSPRAVEREDSSPEHIAQRFVEQGMGARDIAAIAHLLHRDAVDRSCQAVTLLPVLAAFPDLTCTPVTVRSEGDAIVVGSTVAGTHAGAFMGIEPTGKRVVGRRTDWLQVTGGKIVDCRTDFDPRALALQVGAPTSPPARFTPKAPSCVGAARQVIAQRFVGDVLSRRRSFEPSTYFVDEPRDHVADSLVACLTLAAIPSYELIIEEVVENRSTVIVRARIRATSGSRVLVAQASAGGLMGRVAMSFRITLDGRFAETRMRIEKLPTEQ